MKIIEVTDKKSLAILKYISELTNIMENNYIKTEIVNWNQKLFKKADIKHFHYSNSSFKVLLHLLFSNKNNTIVTIHDVLPRNKIWRIIFTPIIFRIIDYKSKILIIHSNSAKNLLINNFQFINIDKLKVIPHGCNFYDISIQQIIDTRKKLGLNTKDIIFIYVGFLKSSKGILKTLEAFDLTINNKAKFFLIGKISDRNIKHYLEDLAFKNITYLGRLSDDDLKDWYIASDALVNFRENFVGETSGSVMQMIGFGKPILASNLGINKEIIEDAGLFCNCNVKSIKQLYTRFIFDKKLRVHLKQKAEERRNIYRWENIFNQYKTIL
jgi:glycosyltransferase involved in cell wall biosynthesis